VLTAVIDSKLQIGRQRSVAPCEVSLNLPCMNASCLVFLSLPCVNASCLVLCCLQRSHSEAVERCALLTAEHQRGLLRIADEAAYKEGLKWQVR